MVSKIHIFKSILKSRSFSVTKARQQVYETLSRNGAISISTLVKLTTVDRSSIYRTVYLFEQLGIVHRVYAGWKYTIELSDLFDNHHHHASCTRCGKVMSLTDDHDLENAIEKLSKKYNFKVTKHQVELSGFCDTCQ